MRFPLKTVVGLSAGAALLAAVPLFAQIDLPNTFEAGTTASAGEVNANFEALAAENAQLRDRLETVETLLAELQAHMEVTTDAQGYPAIVISGANLHVNNGEGATDSVNGTGNLIIGYDEPMPETEAFPVCSLGGHTDQGDCESNGGIWANSHKSGSHNLVIGREHNYSRYGGLVAGRQNTVNGEEASVSGGILNTASGSRASVSGGGSNTASSSRASVSGGARNTASGSLASVSGGARNTASGSLASVSGGDSNTASGLGASVSGGTFNTASSEEASVSGGVLNTASGNWSSVSGGRECEASSHDGWIADC